MSLHHNPFANAAAAAGNCVNKIAWLLRQAALAEWLSLLGSLQELLKPKAPCNQYCAGISWVGTGQHLQVVSKILFSNDLSILFMGLSTVVSSPMQSLDKNCVMSATVLLMPSRKLQPRVFSECDTNSGTAGVFVSSWLGGLALQLGEWIIKKLPLVKHIYSAAKQVSAAVNPANETAQSFRECVIIRHPRHGEYAFGFITGHTRLQV